MMDHPANHGHGVLTAPDTLTIRRRLPGTVERVWAHLTESDLRRQWFAAGDMELRAGTEFELVWRNDELTDPPGQRPPGFSGEHREHNRLLECDPPRRLVFAFGKVGVVSFALEPDGDHVLLTLVHSRIPDRAVTRKVGPGWHAHLAVLEARLAGRPPAPFWDDIHRLRAEYETLIPA